jgi:hypothetical protein
MPVSADSLEHPSSFLMTQPARNSPKKCLPKYFDESKSCGAGQGRDRSDRLAPLGNAILTINWIIIFGSHST